MSAQQSNVTIDKKDLQEARESNVYFYRVDLPEISQPVQKLLEEYSGLSPDKIASHLHEVVRLQRDAYSLSMVD